MRSTMGKISILERRSMANRENSSIGEKLKRSKHPNYGTVQQIPASVATPSTAFVPLYKTRTVISGLWLAALAGLYFVLVYPVAIAEVPAADYRFDFNIIAAIYAVDLGILTVEYFYKLVRPQTSYYSPGRIGRSNAFGISLRTAFMLVIGGSYVTGAAVATPTVFNSFAQILGATSTVFYADYLHAIFATLMIAVGAVIVVFEVARIAMKKSTIRDWFIKARYPEIKLFWWFFAVGVLAQGVLGLFLLGTVSPLGPWGLLGSNGYSFEDLARHIHGPLGAVVFALFTNHIYFRLRPEFHIR